MAGRMGQPSPAAGTSEDLIQAFRRQRQTTPRPLEHHEHPVGGRGCGPFLVQAATQGIEKPVRRRDDPVMTALARHDHQPPLSDLHILEPQAQHLTPAQSRQQHAQHHRLVPVRAQRTKQPVRLLR